jgi:HEAT repeat protein
MRPTQRLNNVTMTTDEALQFLRSHQPLPPTREISEDLLARFDDVRKHFAARPDNRSVPLLLNALGEGDGHGVYQLVENTILAHPENIVIPALLEGLRSPHASVRQWSVEIAANYARPEFVGPLVEILRQGSVDQRMAAVIALQVIGTPEARRELENATETDIEDEVKETIRKALGL